MQPPPDDTKKSGKRPDTPTGVAVEAQNGKVVIRWEPVSGATAYRINWSHAPITSLASTTRLDNATSPYVHDRLTNDRPYYYVVTAQNANGDSAYSAEVSTVPSPFYEPIWASVPPVRTIRHTYDALLSDAQNGLLLRTAIQDLAPGDCLEIGAGTYSIEPKLQIDLRGTSTAPIRIVAAAGAKPVITRPNASQNTVNVGDRTGCAYLCIRGLEVTGGATGIKMYDCSHVWIDRCHIHHCGGAGLSTNSADTAFLHLTKNEIHHTSGTAEGMYLGANNAKYVMHTSMIVGNYIHHCYGSQGDGIEIKQGSYGNWVAENVVHDCNYPCITVYGTNGRAPNFIERNICYRSNDNVMQVQGEAVVRNNLLMSGAAGFQSHDHQGQSRNLVFIHNTIINEGRGANLSSWNGRPGMVFANNVVYSRTAEAIRFSGGSTGVHVTGNVVVGTVVGTGAASYSGDGLADFRDIAWDASRRDAVPADESIAGRGDPTYVPDRDVRGHIRRAQIVAGAYDAAPQ